MNALITPVVTAPLINSDRLDFSITYLLIVDDCNVFKPNLLRQLFLALQMSAK